MFLLLLLLRLLWLFLARRERGSCGARRVGGGTRAGQRLRSGAFAPDCPVVIFVAA